MPRRPRQCQAGNSPVYHVVNRGILRQTIFHDGGDCETFVEIIRRYKQSARFLVYHWCVMGNHYHLVLELEDPQRISKIIGGIQQVYAGRYHKRHGTAGRLFSSRFKSQVIDKDAYLAVCGRYVERNPVRAGLVVEPWDWGQSSARFYVLGHADGITDRDPLVPAGDGRKYAEWLSEDVAEESALFRSGETVIEAKGLRSRKLIHDDRVTGPRRGRRRLDTTL